MIKVCYFNFDSFIDLDKDKSKISFKAKGYIKEENGVKIYYFTNDNDKYKFYIYKNMIKVEFNDSKYSFIKDSVSEGTINLGNNKIVCKVITKELVLEDIIRINYDLILNDMKGSYIIVVEPIIS